MYLEVKIRQIRINADFMSFDVEMHQERHGFCFWTLNDRKKGAADTFRGDKLTIKVCLK